MTKKNKRRIISARKFSGDNYKEEFSAENLVGHTLDCEIGKREKIRHWVRRRWERVSKLKHC